MAEDIRILVVGGGIAGLSVVRALQLRGFRPDVVERSTSGQRTGAGMFIPGNGVRALESLGLAAQVEDRGAIVMRQRVLDDRGRTLVDFDAADFWRDVAPPVAIHRRDLHEVLLRSVRDKPIRFGTAVRSIDADDRVVSVGFSDGASSRYDLVVGADGVESAVRQAITGRRGARLVGQVGWRFVVGGMDAIVGWNAWLGRDRTFLAVALGHGEVYAYADARAIHAGDPTSGDPARLAAMFDSFPTPVRNLLRRVSAGDVWFSPIEELPAANWGTGRVALVGDAAHAMSPNMAEGASLAVEDGLVLAEELSRHRDVADALGSFARRRTSRVEWVLSTTHSRDRIRYLNPLARGAILRLGGRRTFRAHYRPLLSAP